MAYEYKEGRGSVFPNDYHEPGDNKPCLKGGCKIDGVVYDVALWAPDKDAGQKYFSMSISPPFKPDASNADDVIPEVAPEDLADGDVAELPF